ncbi:MAG TPA: non-canonical purine NTP pyrophosphatase, RdgB/HAM1 family [Rhodospirillaceae bacterium]|nr:non-canonical purine NTP pyrophosphatase, RdgB/HAM1 family [Rhodospirillaceae bacterium]
MRFGADNKLLLATHNRGKLKEFQSLLAPLGVTVVGAGDLALPEPEETGLTFHDNALLKARVAMAATGLPALADDSGLCVNALGGQPGLHSARWCGDQRDPMVGMKRVHEELGELPDRSAYFICVLTLVWPDGAHEIVEGRCDGQIIWPPRGALGHGYDPFFQPDGETRTFGEMSEEEKQALSHRGRAMEKLLAVLHSS